MNTTGFGRRVVLSDSRELAVVSETTEPQGLRADFGRVDLKEQIRAELMQRIDPAAAGRVSRRTLQAQIAILVSEIATEHKVQLNELEEAALAAELTDDMIGLGPLEPLLQMTQLPISWSTDHRTFMSSGKASSKRHKHGSATHNMSSI
jgi:hypothetical protein